jgi:hypothetical protein
MLRIFATARFFSRRLLALSAVLLRGGSSDYVLVGVRIRSAGVAQLVAFKTPSLFPQEWHAPQTTNKKR